MAGAGYKLFATGDVLTAAQVNTYLMQQTVMVFASSAARTSALSGVLAEGMVSYLQDTNTLEVYDGAAWVGATGDITALTAGTGISITNPTGPVPTVAIDTAVTADLTTAQTLTNKTLTSPVLTTPSISNINAKGDILVGTADNTLGIITAGSNGETLVADSAATTGLRYQAPKTQNALYNSGFDIAQRGTSFTGLSATDYTLDRWMWWSTTGGQSNYASQQSVGNLSVSPNQAIRYCGRFGRTAATTNTGARVLQQSLETADSVRFAGQTVTMSFYARAGANYSATSNGLNAILQSGTGTDQPVYSFTGSATVVSSVVTLTTSWQRFSITGVVATNVTEIASQFYFNPTGTAGAADYFEITGVQVEVGSVATPFNRQNGTIQGELAACQRYYWRTTGTGYSRFTQFTPASSATLIYAQIQNPVQMRVKPTSIDFSSLIWWDNVSIGNAIGALTINADSNVLNTFLDAASTGMTQYRNYQLMANGGTGYIGLSAEL